MPNAIRLIPRPIPQVAADLGLNPDDVIPYGQSAAKVMLRAFDRPTPPGRSGGGKLILVTALTPTKSGEGKTTTSIGLTDGLRRLGASAVVALREPSMGPVFGMKGGGTGGGRAQLHPSDAINLHFTGDLHAIAAANNLLAAVVDNHLHWRAEPRIDARTVTWRRCLDVNDRALREAVIGLGGSIHGVPRETGFDITAASEIMAVLALATSPTDLQERLERLVIGTDDAGEPVRAGSLAVAGAMAAILADALLPNLAQTQEGTPALVHCGPFANIAHGCSSVLGTRLGLHLADYCVTEAGFGADLGAEKFLHLKCRQAGIWPAAAVLVATARALKLHGGAAEDQLADEDVAALRSGFANVRRHIQNLGKFGLPVVVAINRFPTDTDAELAAILAMAAEAGSTAAISDVYSQGGGGALELAAAVRSLADASTCVPRYLYPETASLREKVETLAREIYRAGHVEWSPAAAESVRRFERWGNGGLPVCVAKTQYSFGDDAKLGGTPDGHTFTVREVRLSAGAGFVVALAGSMMTMPGLPRTPSAARIGVDASGTIFGVR